MHFSPKSPLGTPLKAVAWALLGSSLLTVANAVEPTTTSIPSPSQILQSLIAEAPSLIAAAAGSANGIAAAGLQYALSHPAELEELINVAIADISAATCPPGEDCSDYGEGQSPAVYPSPQGAGSGGWAEAYSKAKTLVATLTDSEKNTLLYGASNTSGCSGFVGAIPSANFPGICLNDAESGVRGANLVNGYPSQIHIGASWNRSLAHDRAVAIGREFKAKGVNVILGPVIGPIGRLAEGGRNWEGFTNEPYLAGELVHPTITGLQESVIACVKHYIAYEQETNRNPFLTGFIPNVGVQSVSSNLDDKTMHELYLWPWYDAMRAEPGSVMASYNRVNNSYASQNSKILNGLLKTELGFQGFVVSDWGGQHTGIASANAGLDLAMPSSSVWDNSQLAKAVTNGTMTSSRLDDMATRILAAYFRYADFTTPGITPHDEVDTRQPSADPVLLQSAVEGHVLVKNVKNALPLKKPKTLSLFGYDGIGGINSTAQSPIAAIYGDAQTTNYTNGEPFTPLQYLAFNLEVYGGGQGGPNNALAGTYLSGAGSGSITPTSSIPPYDAFLSQAAADGTTLYADFWQHNPAVHPDSEACLVFINAAASESYDRTSLEDSYADKLVENIASQCSNTIVSIHNAGIRLVDAWIEHPNVTAVLYSHLPGQMSGPALVEVIYGRQSPSGRLPYTVAKKASDYGSLLGPTLPDPQNPIFPQSNFSEGVFIDYKHFIKQGIKPRFEFGYGLTYTTFSYSNLMTTIHKCNTAATPPDALHSSEAVAPQGGLESLYDVVATVKATVKNTGQYTASEVAQLYLGIPGHDEPERVLRGFQKQSIAPGKSAVITFPLRRRDLSVWDSQTQQWIMQPGALYKIWVGKSVLDTPLTGELRIPA